MAGSDGIGRCGGGSGGRVAEGINNRKVESPCVIQKQVLM